MDTIEHLEAQVEELTDMIKVQAEPFMREIEILTSMTGVSVMAAIAITADVIDVSRFKNAKHFASYLSSAPRVESSNNTTVIKSTNKAGRKVSVTMLSQSLNHFRDCNKALNAWYEKASVFKKKGVVRMALCRKVITQIFQMLKKGEYHRFRNPMLHDKKMAEYKVFLEKHQNGAKYSTILQKSA